MFAEPIFFYGLFFVAGIMFFCAWKQRARKNQIAKFAQEHLSDRLLRQYDPRKEKRREILLVCGFFFVVLALARPQWGNRWEHMKKRGLDILIALDVSKSMMTQDIKPNRLERSKLALKDFVRKLNGDRVGLIAFAGDAYLACPLTSDYTGFNLVLDDLSTKSIARGGTDIGAAIREAKRAYEGAAGPHKILILITDGENHEGDPVAEAQSAKKDSHIHIYTIGVGTTEGELISAPEDGNFLKDSSGLVVKSRLDEITLRKIAEASDGLTIHATPTEFGLETLYEKSFSNIEKKVYEDKAVALREERFQGFLLLAFLCFVAESFWSQNFYARAS
jgi:Ca-activated chloride channel homolog